MGIILNRNNLSPGPVISRDKLFCDTGVSAASAALHWRQETGVARWQCTSLCFTSFTISLFS